MLMLVVLLVLRWLRSWLPEWCTRPWRWMEDERR
jgi:hypothetical protein